MISLVENDDPVLTERTIYIMNENIDEMKIGDDLKEAMAEPSLLEMTRIVVQSSSPIQKWLCKRFRIFPPVNYQMQH